MLKNWFSKISAQAWASFGIALLLRLIYLVFLSKSPLFDSPDMDARIHDEWAFRIAHPSFHSAEDANFLSLTTPFFRAPLYPYFLSLVYLFFKRSWGAYTLMRVLQFVMGALSAAMVCRLASRSHGAKAGLLAGLMAAFYWPFIYGEGELLLEALFVPLLLLAFCLLEESGRRADLRWHFSTGLAFGLACITRPNLLAFLPVLALWIYKSGSFVRPRASCLAILAGLCLCILPVTLHNALSGDPVLISSQGGVNFFIGNNAQSDGRTAVVPGTRASWWGGYEDAQRLAEQAEGRKLRPSEASSYWLGQGLKFLRQEPAKALQLYLLKLKLFFNPVEVSNNQNVYFFRNYTGFINLPFFIGFGFVAPLAFAGLVFLRKKGFDWLLLSFTAIYSLSVLCFFVADRYRLPIVPFLMIYAAGFLTHAMRLYQEKAWKALALSLALSLGLAASLQAIRLPDAEEAQRFSSGDFDLANAYARKGDNAKAYEIYQKTAELPGPSGSRSLFFLGVMDLKTLDAAQAEAHFKRAYALEAALGQEILGTLAEAGLGGMAERILVDKDSPQALKLRVYMEIGNAMGGRGNYAGAAENFRYCLKVSPQFAPAWAGLGKALASSGDLKGARMAYQKALALDPGNEYLKQMVDQPAP